MKSISERQVWLYEVHGINPLPWTPGTIAVSGRRKWLAKDPALETYQQAVKEYFTDYYPGTRCYPAGTPLKIEFHFWRELEQATDAEGVRRRAKKADTTNLQKALEDALQGVLYVNDDMNVDVRSKRWQSVHTRPLIHIYIEEADVDGA